MGAFFLPFYIFILILCNSCMQSSNELEKEKQLSVNITDKFISLSDLYDSAKFVPLENGEQCMIGYAKKQLKKTTIFFYSTKNHIHQLKFFLQMENTFEALEELVTEKANM